MRPSRRKTNANKTNRVNFGFPSKMGSKVIRINSPDSHSTLFSESSLPSLWTSPLSRISLAPMMVSKIDRYLTRQVLVSTLFAVMVLSMVLILGNVFKEVHDLLVNKRAPISFVAIFILHSLGLPCRRLAYLWPTFVRSGNHRPPQQRDESLSHRHSGPPSRSWILFHLSLAQCHSCPPSQGCDQDASLR